MGLVQFPSIEGLEPAEMVECPERVQSSIPITRIIAAVSASVTVTADPVGSGHPAGQATSVTASLEATGEWRRIYRWSAGGIIIGDSGGLPRFELYESSVSNRLLTLNALDSEEGTVTWSSGAESGSGGWDWAVEGGSDGVAAGPLNSEGIVAATGLISTGTDVSGSPAAWSLGLNYALSLLEGFSITLDPIHALLEGFHDLSGTISDSRVYGVDGVAQASGTVLATLDLS